MTEIPERTLMHGGCLCGAVTYRIHAASKWCAHCHCSLCRRAHGAGYVTWLGCEEDTVEIEDDASMLRWFASSSAAERGFCGRCGSTLFFRSGRWPGELHIAVGCLDDGPDRTPQAHVYWESRVDWIEVADSLPRRTSTET